MKYVYILIAVALLVGGYFLINTLSSNQQDQQSQEVPEGYHRMPDGTLMRNSGVEGMGAMEEMRQDMQEQEDTSASADTAEAIPADAKVFEVRGSNYAFDVQEITVAKGDTVVINFQSTGGFHDWTVDVFDAQTQKVQPGTQTSVTFVADEAGTFEYYCSVGDHRARGMVGTLTVTE